MDKIEFETFLKESAEMSFGLNKKVKLKVDGNVIYTTDKNIDVNTSVKVFYDHYLNVIQNE